METVQVHGTPNQVMGELPILDTFEIFQISPKDKSEDTFI